MLVSTTVNYALCRSDKAADQNFTSLDGDTYLKIEISQDINL